MDPWTWLQAFITSAFANVVVVGLAGASIVTLGGTFYLVINFDVAKKHVLNGLLLTLMLGALSLAQLGVVPRSFTHVGELGLMAVPAGGATVILDTITGVLRHATTWVGYGLITIGLILIVTRVNWVPKMVIVGLVMIVLAGLSHGDGMLYWATWVVSRIWRLIA